MGTILYDTGALIAAERADQRLSAFHKAARLSGWTPVVPVVVLAQAWRGGPQPRLSRLLKGCDVLPDTEHIGRRAGRACAKAGTSDVVDAIVVVTALELRAPVVTSDPHDLGLLLDALDESIEMHVV